jgi:DNA primase
MSNLLRQHDLDRADGRLAALRAAAPLVASIRDNALVSGYAREAGRAPRLWTSTRYAPR